MAQFWASVTILSDGVDSIPSSDVLYGVTVIKGVMAVMLDEPVANTRKTHVMGLHSYLAQHM